MALDNHLPLIHPYMVVDTAKPSSQTLCALPASRLAARKGATTDARDLQIITDICCAPRSI